MISLDDALQTFIAEGRELLEQMEEALLGIEQSPNDVDALNAIFRAAHTIKGSAGLFGLDHIVAFTHVAESVLDLVRGGLLPITPDLVATLLGVRDQIAVLLDHLAAGEDPDEEVRRKGDELVTRLRLHLGPPQLAAPVATVCAAAAPAPNTADGVGTDNWHISLRFGPDVLKNGMDPLAFIRYLTTFGTIAHIVTLSDTLPALSELDPEACYLGFEIAYRSDADKATIEGAFEFVRNDARVGILPPHSKIADYQRLIEALPAHEELPLGEILVRCGTLTRAELETALSRQAESGESPPRPIGEILVRDKVVRSQVVEGALDKQKQVKEHKSAEAGLIRVNAHKLDEHINLIGELIIASAGAALIAQRTGMADLLEAAARLSRLVEEVRDSALTLRMVPIGATFTKFQRVVRDVSTDLGKDIRLEVSGAETELDKTVVEKIGDPLTHLVRNSMDHGIEPAELRLARGKPAHGTVRLNAYHDSGSIVIEVSDDGGGLDRERIFAKAVERGMVKADAQLSDAEVFNLIFEAGLSTVDQVSNLSGRGVGMDVVRRNIAALRGSVEIESSPGAGTTIRVRLPLTLAIIDGFLVGVSAATFVVPLDMVVECIELTQQEMDDSQGSDYLNLRGEVLPFVRLKQMLEIPELAEAEGGEISKYDAGYAGAGGTLLTAEGAAALANDPELAFLLNPVKRENVVVVQYAGHRAGLVVDRLMGEFQTVIRPLGVVFNGLDGVSGFTILGNGNVALILDVPGLVRRVARRNTRAAAASVVDLVATN
jgi:two-component system, chemotaxis family, sensor kinase CheA